MCADLQAASRAGVAGWTIAGRLLVVEDKMSSVEIIATGSEERWFI